MRLVRSLRMAFNARWALEELSRELNCPLPDLLLELQTDFAALVRSCPVYRLDLQLGSNCFRLLDRRGSGHTPSSLPGLYAVFTRDAVVYFGEASDLCRRHLKDPDNTANSNKIFTNQGRAVLKLLLHRGWTERLALSPLLIRLYPADCRIETKQNRTFEECYRVSQFHEALDGALALFVPRHHQGMLARASLDQLIEQTQKV